MHRLFVIVAAIGATAWSGAALAAVDESTTKATNNGQELNGATVPLTTPEGKPATVKPNNPRTETKTETEIKTGGGNKKTGRPVIREESQTQQHPQQVDPVQLGIGIGLGLGMGGIGLRGLGGGHGFGDHGGDRSIGAHGGDRSIGGHGGGSSN